MTKEEHYALMKAFFFVGILLNFSVCFFLITEFEKECRKKPNNLSFKPLPAFESFSSLLS